MTERRQPTARDQVRAVRVASFQALLPHAALGLLLVVLFLVVGDELGHHIGVINATLEGLGPWSVVAFVALFVAATSVLVPETPLAITAGALFGMPKGLLAVVVGGLAAAVFQLLLSRRVLRRRIEKRLMARPSLAALQRAVLQNELRLQVMLRLMPLHSATINYLLGAAGVRLRGFLLASLASVPHQMIEVYLGYAGAHVTTIAGRSGSPTYTHDAVVLGGLLLTVILVAAVARAALRAVGKAVAALPPTPGAEVGPPTRACSPTLRVLSSSGPLSRP